MKGFFIVFLCFSFVFTQKYAVRYMIPHCFTCSDGGKIAFKTFDSKQNFESWLNENNHPNSYSTHTKLFKLVPIVGEKKDLGRTHKVRAMVEREEPLIEWVIHDDN